MDPSEASLPSRGRCCSLGAVASRHPWVQRDCRGRRVGSALFEARSGLPTPWLRPHTKTERNVSEVKSLVRPTESLWSLGIQSEVLLADSHGQLEG